MKGKIGVKTMVTCIVTMSQLGEAVVSDGPAKSWAIGSAGSAPSSSRVRFPPTITFTYFFDFVCSLSSLFAWLKKKTKRKTFYCARYVNYYIYLSLPYLRLSDAFIKLS